MAKKFKFPEGTIKVSAKEIKEALCNYEVVEFPGSIIDLTIKIPNQTYENDVVTREIILNEGTQIFNYSCSSTIPSIKYNVPKSLCEIMGNIWRDSEGGFHAPRVLCLPTTFRKSHELRGVEYLQAYSSSEIRYFHLPNLKHYNYLGDKMSLLQYLFSNLPKGCVIHVENKKMAKSVLKKVNVKKAFVIPDAAEWKDFPADKLAMTMEEYDPESRMLPEQKKMREEQRKAEEEEQQKEEEELRKRKKMLMLENMSKSILEPVLSQLIEPYTEQTYSGTTRIRPGYNIDVTDDKDTGEPVFIVEALITRDLWNDQWNRSMMLKLTMTMEEVTGKIDSMKEHFMNIRDFVLSHMTAWQYHGMGFGYGNRTPHVPSAGLSLPFLDSIMVGSINPATIEKDVRTIKDITSGLEDLIKKAKHDFPKGVTIVRM